jgi:cardiolipin synthase
MMTANFLTRNWPDIVGLGLLLDFVLVAITLIWILHTKRETMSAIAWSLTVLLLPIFGALFFLIFGVQSIARPMARKQRRKSAYKLLIATDSQVNADTPSRWDNLAKLAYQSGGFPVTDGNRVVLYHDTHPAYEAMLTAIRAAKHHVHVQFFILRGDNSGKRFFEALSECSARGVEVRLLYDSVGSYNLPRRCLRPLRQAGGRVAAFLPILNPLYRFRVNLRNHRKIVVVDGRIGFTGGLNIGDEYLGLHPKYGHWRDTFLRVEGPAVHSLQQVFLEDWDFATTESVHGLEYYPQFKIVPGQSQVQVVHSGPDLDYKAIRESYFAAILNAERRVWIASPYFVPDTGLLNALSLKARTGVDVRFLGLFRPDKWLPYLAARFYWTDMLAAGVKVYQYSLGMMHSKYVLVDGEWASVGTANLDNRSLLLNFEVNCQLFDPTLVEELENAFLKDLTVSVRIDPLTYANRPWVSQLAENAARLFSPIL